MLSSLKIRDLHQLIEKRKKSCCGVYFISLTLVELSYISN